MSATLTNPELDTAPHTDTAAIRPFQATRWPDEEPVADRSQGAPLAKLVGCGLTDPPAGLAGWMLVHGGFGTWVYGKDPAQAPTRDEGLDNLSRHWENRDHNLISAAAQQTAEIALPVAMAVFLDDDLVRAPEPRGRRAFPSQIYIHAAAGAATSPPGRNRDSSATTSARPSARCTK